MMRPPIITVAAMALAMTALVGLAAADRPAEAPGGREMLAGSADNVRGAQVYEQICSACHEAGVERAPQRAMLQLMTADSIHRALTTGVMKDQGDQLTEDERVQVAEYLTHQKLGAADATPRTPQCEGATAKFDPAQPPAFPGWGFTRGNTRVIPTATAGVGPADVDRLRVSWAMAYPNALRARSQPAVAWGAAYVGSHDGTVYALDRKTGCARWTFRAPAEVRTGVVAGFNGAKDPRPTIYFGDLIGDVFALDARTGEELWRVRPDLHPNATITGAPTLYRGVLYVPVSSLEVLPAAQPTYACCTFRGSVVALDAATGRQLWQSFTVAQPPSPQKPNAAGVVQLGPSGAPIWNSPVIDEKRRRLYVGTGENYSSPATATSDALMAMDLATGKIVWTYQATAGDAWNAACSQADRTNCPVEDGPDHDFGAGAVLAHASDGRDIVLGGQKSGVVHALDAQTGKLLWKVKLGRGGNRGGVHFGLAVAGDRVFVPISDDPDGHQHAEPPTPGLYALDLKTGARLWSSPAEDGVCNGRKFCNPGVSVALTATPTLVFAGGMDGWLRIHDAATGKVLWRFDTARAFHTAAGVDAVGGSFSGGAGPVVYGGMVLINSGYGFSGKMPGNLLLALDLAPPGASAADGEKTAPGRPR